MAKIHQQSENFFVFWCPGCHTTHSIRTPLWGFNNDIENPTIEGSILAIGLMICHSYVTNGWIRFLDDCEHDLKGQTVELPEWPNKYSSHGAEE